MILALTGPQRAGKTTALNRLVDSHGFHRMSIADMIKDEAHRLVGRSFTDREKDHPHPALNGKSPRDLYIHVGNLDEYDHGFWVRKMFAAQYHGPDEQHVVESVGKQFQHSEIVRFCERARDGVVIVDVTRPDHDYKDSRHGIRDSYPVIRLNNDLDQGRFEGLVSDLVGQISKLRHQRTLRNVSEIEAIEKEVYDK